MNVVRVLPKVADLGGKDPDHIVELCNEVNTLRYLVSSNRFLTI